MQSIRQLQPKPNSRVSRSRQARRYESINQQFAHRLLSELPTRETLPRHQRGMVSREGMYAVLIAVLIAGMVSREGMYAVLIAGSLIIGAVRYFAGA